MGFGEIKLPLRRVEYSSAARLKYDAVFLGGEAVLMMELPRRHSTPSEGGRFAPIKSSNYGGRPLTGPRPDDLSEFRLVEWFGWVNE